MRINNSNSSTFLYSTDESSKQITSTLHYTLTVEGLKLTYKDGISSIMAFELSGTTTRPYLISSKRLAWYQDSSSIFCTKWGREGCGEGEKRIQTTIITFQCVIRSIPQVIIVVSITANIPCCHKTFQWTPNHGTKHGTKVGTK